MTISEDAGIRVERLGNGPIITGNMDSRMGDNVNGPSLIRVPDWLPNPLGRYYLYFGHHQGGFIRLAFADDLHGPWRIYAPGTLQLAQTACISPEEVRSAWRTSAQSTAVTTRADDA